MPDVSRIRTPDGDVLDIKDAVARNAIANINSFDYIIAKDASTTPTGVTWTVNDITTTGTLVPSKNTLSKIYLVPSVNGSNDTFDEYLTIETSSDTYEWELFGNTDAHLEDLGQLAFKNSTSASYTPEGTVSKPTFTGDEMTSTGNVTATGTVSKPTFSGSEGNVSVSGTPTGTIGVGSGTANYTPAGSVSVPEISVVPSMSNIYVASSAQSGGAVQNGVAASCVLPTLSTRYEDETLTLNWTDGTFTPNTPTAVTLPTFATKSVATGVESATASQPTFRGTGVQLAFTGDALNSTGKFTPAGEVSQPTFSGDSVAVSVSGTPTGSVSQPTFSGDTATITST